MPAISTPCIKLCVIGADGRCDGCGRTLDEIARWGRMSEAERRAIMARLPPARAVRAEEAGPEPRP